MKFDDAPDDWELRAIARNPVNVRLNRELGASFDRLAATQRDEKMLKLPTVARSTFDVRPIDWTGLNHRYMNPGELEVLVALVRSVSPRHVIEIGVNTGRTAKAILANVPGIEHYTGIDVPLGYVPEKAVQRYEVPANPGDLALGDARFQLLLRPRGSLDLTPQELAPADAVFIDGDHGHVAVEHDSALARAVVRRPGIIVWHDYHKAPTVDVAAVLHQQHAAGHELIHVEGTWLVFERFQ